MKMRLNMFLLFFSLSVNAAPVETAKPGKEELEQISKQIKASPKQVLEAGERAQKKRARPKAAALERKESLTTEEFIKRIPAIREELKRQGALEETIKSPSKSDLLDWQKEIASWSGEKLIEEHSNLTKERDILERKKARLVEPPQQLLNSLQLIEDKLKHLETLGPIKEHFKKAREQQELLKKGLGKVRRAVEEDED